MAHIPPGAFWSAQALVHRSIWHVVTFCVLSWPGVRIWTECRFRTLEPSTEDGPKRVFYSTCFGIKKPQCDAITPLVARTFFFFSFGATPRVVFAFLSARYHHPTKNAVHELILFRIFTFPSFSRQVFGSQQAFSTLGPPTTKLRDSLWGCGGVRCAPQDKARVRRALSSTLSHSHSRTDRERERGREREVGDHRRRRRER